ncbi:MAG: MFS transporter, partial [Bacillota bacterium]
YRNFLALNLFIQSFLLLAMGLPISPWSLSTLSVTTIYVIMLVIMILMGITNALVNVPVMTLFQRMIPDNLRGRLFGLLGTFSQGLMPISMGLVGILLDQISPYSLFILAGTVSMLISYSVVKIPAFEEFAEENPGMA